MVRAAYCPLLRPSAFIQFQGTHTLSCLPERKRDFLGPLFLPCLVPSATQFPGLQEGKKKKRERGEGKDGLYLQNLNFSPQSYNWSISIDSTPNEGWPQSEVTLWLESLECEEHHLGFCLNQCFLNGYSFGWQIKACCLSKKKRKQRV